MTKVDEEVTHAVPAGKVRGLVMRDLGPYEIRGELGRGAMAVVWRGYDSHLRREVAIKEAVAPHGTTPEVGAELAERFVREGRVAASLGHPGIVIVYAAELFGDRPAIVMELLEGRTLRELLDNGPLSARDAASIASQLLEALAYAHARGVVHRDIKPDNVFVTGDGRVKLTDFGIAHVGTSTALTQAGTIMGTPGYMAPEQVRGEPVDARADLFAVGVLLYEMLTGANAFTAGNAHPTTVMFRVLNEELPDVRERVPNAGEGPAAAIAKATAKDCGGRFASAEEMRRALSGGDLGVPLPAGPAVTRQAPSAEEPAVPPPVGPVAAWRPRSRLALGATIALILLGVLAWLVWPSASSSELSSGGDTAAAPEEAKPPAEPTPAVPREEALHTPTYKPTGKEVAVITTAKGVIKLEFYATDAPNHVASFIELAKKGIYDGTTFHRVEPGFVVQGGDPYSKSGEGLAGTGGPGYRLAAEFNSRKHELGTLAMARSADPDSAGSQFYICLAPQPGLDGQYTVFGKVIEGMDVVEKIAVGDVMTSVKIEEKN